MLRYILFSVFALLLLTACGGVITDQAGEKDTKKTQTAKPGVSEIGTTKDDVGKNLNWLLQQNNSKSCPGCELVTADLGGTQSHGVLRVPEYVKKVPVDGVDPRGRPRIVTDSGAVFGVAGGNSM